MSAPEYYEASFRWPHPEAKNVVVTGEFDAWTGSHHLTRTANGFEGTVQIPWGRKIPYKYIVDGRWTTTDDQPTELDSIGNLNNVLNAPARPPTPKAPTLYAPEPTPKVAESVQPAGVVNGVLTSAKNAAVAMVEAIAPGTTETPQPTPVVTADSDKDQVLDAAQQVKEEGAAQKNITDTTSDQVEEAIGAPAPKPEPVLPTPKEEVNVDSVSASETTTAPIVPILIVPLAAATDQSGTDGQADKTQDISPAHSSAMVDSPLESPETTDTASGVHVEPSTHTPVVNGTEASVSADATVTPAATNGTSGTLEEKPQEIPLPAPTPSEVPIPTTPPANGKPTETPSQASSPPNSPRKEKRGFPSFNRHHRQSSSGSISTNGTPDEHGVSQSPSRNGTQKKKRTSSFFTKIKDIFHHDHKEEQKDAKAAE